MPTDGAFRGVTVPKGTSRVEFRYEPRAFSIGIVLGMTGLAAFALVGLAATWRTRRARSSSRPDSVGWRAMDGAPDVRGTGTWPKQLPAFTEEEQGVRDAFMARWLEYLPQRGGFVERFNHGYPLRAAASGQRTLEIGAGLGAHLALREPGAPAVLRGRAPRRARGRA